MKNGIIAIMSAFGSFLANQLGGWSADLKLLVGCMVVDYMTGLIVAGIFKKSNKSESGALDSKAGFKGLAKKIAILMFVYLAVLLDGYTGTAYIRTAVCLFFAANEGLSILENFGLMGVPYPAFMKKALESLKEKADAGQMGQ